MEGTTHRFPIPRKSALQGWQLLPSPLGPVHGVTEARFQPSETERKRSGGRFVESKMLCSEKGKQKCFWKTG